MDDVGRSSDELQNNAPTVEGKRCKLPNAPPNYRGMIYDMAGAEWTAEGIERVARNDCGAFSAEVKGGGARPRAERREGEPRFCHLEPPVGCVSKEAGGGIRRILEGMESKSFLPEDVLICAMIMLMLNGKSEDDLLMVLVLMVLL